MSRFDGGISVRGDLAMLMAVLLDTGLTPEEVHGWINGEVMARALDFVSVREGLQYLSLMRVDKLVQAFRLFGVSPDVRDVYRLGAELGWIDVFKLEKWGFWIVEALVETDGVDEEYLGMVPVDKVAAFGGFRAAEVSRLLATGFSLGPKSARVAGEQFPDAPVAIVQKLQALSVETVVSAPVEGVPLVDTGVSGFGYAKALGDDVRSTVVAKLGAYPSLPALVECVESVGSGTLSDGWELNGLYPGVFSFESASDANGFDLFKDMKEAAVRQPTSIICDGTPVIDPFVIVRTDLDLLEGPEKPCGVGDVVQTKLSSEKDGWQSLHFPSSLPVLVTVPMNVSVQFVGGQVFRHEGGPFRVLGLAGLGFKVHGLPPGFDLEVEVGDEFMKDVWMRWYGWFGGDSAGARFVSRSDVRLMVFNLGAHFDSFLGGYSDECPPLAGQVDGDEWSEHGAVPGVEVFRFDESGMARSREDGVAYRVERGNAKLVARGNRRSSELTLSEGSASVAIFSDFEFRCELESGAVALQAVATVAYELDDGGPEDGFFDREF